MKRSILLLCVVTFGASHAAAQVPSLRQARQRASYQVARIENALQEDSTALYHAHRLYAMLDSMVKADSLAALSTAYDTIRIGYLPHTDNPSLMNWRWSDMVLDSISLRGEIRDTDTGALLAAGQQVDACAYMLIDGVIVAKSYDYCPDPPATAMAFQPLLVDTSTSWGLGG